MNWLRGKSYSLQAGKPKKPVETMDTILKGILSSTHPEGVKKNLLQKIAEKGSETQAHSVVVTVLDLTSRWVLDGETELEQVFGLNVFISWAKHNLPYFEQFFDKDYLVTLLHSKKFHNEAKVPTFVCECMRLLQMSSLYSSHCTVVKTLAANYVREHPFLECLKNFATFLLEFTDCIPTGEVTSVFCANLIHSISLCQAPEEGRKIVEYIKHVNTVASLVQHVWSNADSNVVVESLKVIFSIISSDCDVEPGVCLGSLSQFLPNDMMHAVVKSVISDSKINNNSMITAVQRMIDWLQWPTSKFVDDWVIGFLKGLASVQKYSVLITVTDNKVDQIFEKLQFAPVREPGLNIVSHMLLSFQHSPEPFHKILPMVPKIVGLWKADVTPYGRTLMTQLAELLHIQLYLHAGFPELYDPVYELIKEYLNPSPDVIKFKLQSSKWTAHRDGLAQISRSYQQKAEIGKTGLFNLGNTCYMNSVLQALYMCDGFRNDLLVHKPSLEQGLIVKLQYVFAFMSLSQRPAYAPMTFLSASRPPWFISGFQQDCSEFLKYLLDQLHEQEQSCLQKSSKGSHSRNSSVSSIKSVGSNGHSGKLSRTKCGTLIEQNFGGKMMTTFTCLNCHTESTHSELFIDIPLAFPEYNSTSQKSLIGGDSTSTLSTRSTCNSPKPTVSVPNDNVSNCLHLSDLLNHYLKPERLVGDNQYHCDNCGGLQEGERKIRIVETPEYLIFTLLRFSYNTRLQSRSKIFQEVKYPKTLLVPVESETTCSAGPRRDRKEVLQSALAYQIKECDIGLADNSADVYSLCSVVIHSGTSSDCGHYYCYARHSAVSNPETMLEKMQDCSSEDDLDFLQDKWYLFNDSRVSYASYSSFSNVTRRFTKDTAYVLIYKKVNPENLPETLSTAKLEQPLRSDLRTAVTKDNKQYLQEQENAAKRKNSIKRPKSDNSTWHNNWRDDDDKGGSGTCGGGGGLGSMDTCGSRFIF